jgi:hypothetical protein
MALIAGKGAALVCFPPFLCGVLFTHQGVTHWALTA